MTARFARLSRFLGQLERRRVIHVVGLYAVSAWLVVQVTATTAVPLGLPSWVVTLVIVVAAVGFPVAAVLAWAFDVRRAEPEASDMPLLVGSARDGGTAPGRGGLGGASVSAPERTRASGLGGTLRVAVAGVVVLLCLQGGWIAWRSWFAVPGPTAAPAPTALLDRHRLAVLYFDDHSPGGDLGYLVNGLTEALIQRLGQVSALDVVSRNGVKPFRGTGVGLDSVVRTLGAGTLIGGSVQRSGDRVRVAAHLVDGATLRELGTVAVERPWGELFALQDELTREVADRLREVLGAEVRQRERRSAAASVEAWELLHRAEEVWEDGVALWRQGDAAAALRQLRDADGLLARAGALDPAWVEPPVLRGWLAVEEADRTEPAGERRAILARARGHGTRALARRPGDPGALALRGSVTYRLARLEAEPDRAASGLSAAERDLRAAVDREPDRADAWATLSELLHEGRMRVPEARIAARRAYEADAYLASSDVLLYRLCYTSLEMEDYDDVARWCAEGRRRFPEDVGFVALELAVLASDGGPAPDPARAWGLAAETERLTAPDYRAWNLSVARLQVAAVLARAGLADSARAVLDRTLAEAPPEAVPYDEAHVRLLLGETELALARLEEYVSLAPADRVRLARDHWFRPLWEDPRFEALVRAPDADAGTSGEPAGIAGTGG